MLQPDVQLVFNPALTERNAFAIMMQGVIDFLKRQNPDRRLRYSPQL